MATLKDVHHNRQGELAQQNIASPIDGAPEVEPKGFPKQNGIPTSNTTNVGEQFIIFKLKDQKRKGAVYIDGIDDVYNEKTGIVERVRLLSGISTIWFNEQVKMNLSDSYINLNRRTIKFPRGQRFIRVSPKDATLLQFLRLCNSNMDNLNRTGGGKFEFYEYNPLREAQRAQERELKQLEMAFKAREMSVEKMKKHASFLKIQPFNEMGLPKLDEQLRTEYIIYAKNHPDLFEKSVDSEEVDIQFAVKMAITNSIIDIGTQPGTAMWTNSKGIIGRIPGGFEPVKYLTDLAMTNSPDGRKFKEDLKSVK
jgi:hypothetical protein